MSRQQKKKTGIDPTAPSGRNGAAVTMKEGGRDGPNDTAQRSDDEKRRTGSKPVQHCRIIGVRGPFLSTFPATLSGDELPERSGEFPRLTLASQGRPVFAVLVKQQQGDMRHAVLIGEVSAVRRPDIGDDIIDFVVVKLVQRSAGLPLQRHAHGALRIVNLHDRRPAIGDARQIMLVHGASDVLNEEEAHAPDRCDADGAVARQTKEVTATTVGDFCGVFGFL